MHDEMYMARALKLAQRGRFTTHPNPNVGCVIVKDGEIVGEGFHYRAGEPHAEVHALRMAGEKARGATAYVTLEPCCHTGKQPPCTEAVLASGVKRVIVGCTDPNPVVAGRGIRLLREKGLEVVAGVLRGECERQNEVFFHFMRTKLPFTVLKYAMTLDGKTATVSGESQWITGEAARKRVHEDRGRYMAILTGVSTVLADNPQLTCRIPGGKNPIRVIADTKLRTPLSSTVVQTARETPTWIVTAVSDTGRKKAYEDAGCRVLSVPAKEGELDLQAMMQRLGEEKVDSVMVESGGTLAWSFLKAGLVNRVQAYIAPKIFGGAGAPTPVRGTGVDAPPEAFLLKKPEAVWLGEDLLLEYEVSGQDAVLEREKIADLKRRKDVHRNHRGSGKDPCD